MKTIAISIGSFVLGLLLSSHITRSEIRYEEKIVPRVTKRNKIIEAANNVAKTVVSISVTQTRIYRTEPFFFHDDFFDQFFRDIFPPNYYKKEIRLDRKS
ncbi:MAG TPA: hypothetical protein EYP24_02525, partial [bacterium (Candidatus Stahlbacteria)]|nr:hypothetical protein [Candidatus Stahlbacteria bacterium]